MLGTSIVIAATGLGVAAAQDDDTIVVTATKREQTLQEVPIAVSVVDGDVIEKSQIRDMLDLQSVVPSLRVSQLERSANTTFIIRGFGNGGNNIGIEPSVGVFIDGVFRTRSSGSLGDFPDVERVEVLRGPQSTLFGKNASAGVVSFVTKAPSFDWTGSVEATYGNYDQKLVKGYVSGPIDDSTAFSLAGSINMRDGYVDNVSNGAQLNNRNRWMLRGQVYHEASDNVSLRLIADYDTLDEKCCYAPNFVNGPTSGAIAALGGQVPSDPYAYETFLNFNPTNEVTNYGGSAQVDVDYGWADFVSITSLRKQESESTGDVDFTSLNAISDNLNEWDIITFTQELRLSGGTDRFDWLIGGFYYDEQLDKNSNVLYGPQFSAYANVLSGGATPALEAALGLGPFFAEGTGTRETFRHDNESYNLFAQGDFAITDRLVATLGVGYINDEKEVSASAVNDDLYASLNLNDPTIAGVIGQIVFGGVFAGATGLDPTPTNIANFAAADPATFAALQAAAAAATPDSIAALQGLQFLPAFLELPNSVEDNSTNDEDVTFVARLAYDVNDFVNVYGSYSTGYKASSWNLTRDSSYTTADQTALAAANLIPTNRGPGTRFAGPEEVEVWELGLKANFEKGSINVAVFDQSIEGFQSTIFQGTGFVLANAGEQTATGVEVDVLFEPVENLTLMASGLFLDPEYVDYQNAPVVTGSAIDLADGTADGIGDLSGQEPAGIHKTSLFFSAQYDADFGNGMTGFIRGDYQYEDSVKVVDNLPDTFPEREVNLFNASLGLAWENGFEATVWGRNLTEDEYTQSGFPTTAQAGSVNGYPNQPQTYGITVKKSW